MLTDSPHDAFCVLPLTHSGECSGNRGVAETGLFVAPMESALREFTEWFAERFPAGQSVSLPGARLYGIYLHAMAALEDRA